MYKQKRETISTDLASKLEKKSLSPISDGHKRQRNFNIQTSNNKNKIQSAETNATMTEYEQAITYYEKYL